MIFNLPFPPVGRNNHINTRRRAYYDDVRRMYGVCNTPTSEKVVMYVRFSPPAMPGITRYDLDNLQKPIFDALKGIAYIDDNQIRCVHACFGQRVGAGSVSVRIEPITHHRGKPEIK